MSGIPSLSSSKSNASVIPSPSLSLNSLKSTSEVDELSRFGKSEAPLSKISFTSNKVPTVETLSYASNKPSASESLLEVAAVNPASLVSVIPSLSESVSKKSGR